MNKFTLLGAAFAFVSIDGYAQDARPTLAAESTATPMEKSPSAAAVDETILVDDASRADILSTEPILAEKSEPIRARNDAFDQLETKRPFADQPVSPSNGITLTQAVQTALEHNADILRQIAEIKRTRGQVIEIR